MTNPYPYIDNDQWRQAYDCAMATAYSYWRKLCKILPPHIDLDDFQAAARLGLHKASLKFDPGRGTRFNTLAVWWVRTMCEWEFRSNYHLPRAQAQRARKAGRLLVLLGPRGMVRQTGRAGRKPLQRARNGAANASSANDCASGSPAGEQRSEQPACPVPGVSSGARRGTARAKCG